MTGRQETDMKLADSSNTIPLHDYGVALRRAVSWLGDRYLLAEPTPRLRDERKGFFVEPRTWHRVAAAGVGGRAKPGF
jgi:hypothetical protein